MGGCRWASGSRVCRIGGEGVGNGVWVGVERMRGVPGAWGKRLWLRGVGELDVVCVWGVGLGV